MESDCEDEDVCKIIVGGVTFMTERKTLQRFQDTTLSELTPRSKYYKTKWGCYFFDRNPAVFHHVLECYRTGKLHLSTTVCYQVMVEELQFWKLDIGSVLVTPCCLGPFQEYEANREVLKKVYDDIVEESSRDGKVWQKVESASGARLFRYRLYMFLERPNSSKSALMWTLFQIFLVYVCMVMYALMTSYVDSMEFIKEAGMIDNATLSNRSTRKTPTVMNVIQLVDVFINSIFTLDLLVRLAVAPDRVKLLKLATTVVDIICVVTFWIYVVFYVISVSNETLRTNYITARNAMFVIQVLRLVKMTKLSSNFVELRSLLLSLKYSLKEILLINMCFTAVMFLFAVIVYHCESTTEGGFSDIPIAFWWALITMTTVGYGDTVPKTLAGHIVGGLCALTGILLTGMGISILANNLNTYSQLTAQQHRAQKMIVQRMKSGSCLDPRYQTEILYVNPEMTNKPGQEATTIVGECKETSHL